MSFSGGMVLRYVLGAVLCSFFLNVAVASTTSEDEELVTHLQAELAAGLVLPSEFPIDASLASIVRNLWSEHLARMKPVFFAWVAQDRADPELSTIPLSRLHRLRMRTLNEYALWQLENNDAMPDTAWLNASAQIRHCYQFKSAPAFAQRMLAIQSLPVEHRQAAIDGERRLLQRWGTVRANLPIRPVVSVKREVADVLKLIMADTRTSIPAMPPALAMALLNDVKSVQSLGADASCALKLWWLKSQKIDSPEAVAGAWLRWRYASLPDVQDWYANSGSPKADASIPTDYPLSAAFFGVSGVLTLEITLNKNGEFSRAVVVKRAIHVKGLQSSQPIAFETLLDDAALARAAQANYAELGQVAKSKGEAVRASQSFQFVLH